MPGVARDSTVENPALPSATAPGAKPGPGAHPAWTELEDHLESVKRSVLEQIRDYPRPIAACDQQFNYLLEQRDRVTGELSRLASLARDGATLETSLTALDGFISASACIDQELKARLAAELHRRSAEAG